jgi:hypothetical protein
LRRFQSGTTQLVQWYTLPPRFISGLFFRACITNIPFRRTVRLKKLQFQKFCLDKLYGRFPQNCLRARHIAAIDPELFPSLVNRGRSLIASPLSIVFCRRPGSRFSPRSEQSAATSGPKHRCCNVHNELACDDAAQALSRSHRYPRPAGNHYIRDFVRMNLRARRSGGVCGFRPAEWLP